MTLEGMQSDVLKQLGVSHSQLIDYYSQQHAATLVSQPRAADRSLRWI